MNRKLGFVYPRIMSLILELADFKFVVQTGILHCLPVVITCNMYVYIVLNASPSLLYHIPKLISIL